MTEPPKLADTAELKELVEGVETATQWLHQVLAQHGALTGLTEVPAMAPADEVSVLAEQLREARRDADFSKQCDRKLASLQQPPAMEDGALLERLIEHIVEHELTSTNTRPPQRS